MKSLATITAALMLAGCISPQEMSNDHLCRDAHYGNREEGQQARQELSRRGLQWKSNQCLYMANNLRASQRAFNASVDRIVEDNIKSSTQNQAPTITSCNDFGWTINCTTY